MTNCTFTSCTDTEPITGYPDQPLFDGIKKFQKDKGLFQDALMDPGGETVAAINKEPASFLAEARGDQSAMSKQPFCFIAGKFVGVHGRIK